MEIHQLRDKARHQAYDRDDLQIQKWDNHFKINFTQNGSAGYSWKVSQVSKGLKLGKIETEDTTWFDPTINDRQGTSYPAHLQGSVPMDGHYQFHLDYKYVNEKARYASLTKNYIISLDCQNGVISKITLEDNSPAHK